MRTDIVLEIEALSEHYPKPRRDPSAQARWLQDYVNDLTVFSPAQVKAACSKWRTLDGGKFPTPGQIAAICRVSQSVVEQQPVCMSEADYWRRMMDRDYDGLTIREKIAWHEWKAEIADAAACSRKWKLAKHMGDANIAKLRADPEWSRFESERIDHVEEATRLSRIVAERRAA